MQTIELEAHTNADGLLKLEVPVGVANSDVDVVVIVQPKTNATTDEARGWPPGFFKETAGSLANDPTFMRHDQGAYEIREAFE